MVVMTSESCLFDFGQNSLIYCVRASLQKSHTHHISLQKRGIVHLDDSVTNPDLDPRHWHPRRSSPEFDLPTIAAMPLFTNPRMTAQRSAFTLMGDSFLPLERQYDGRLLEDSSLIKIDLPPQTFAEIEDCLRLSGVRAYTYFPDLDGLALDHELRIEAMFRDTKRFYPHLANNG